MSGVFYCSLSCDAAIAAMRSFREHTYPDDSRHAKIEEAEQNDAERKQHEEKPHGHEGEHQYEHRDHLGHRQGVAHVHCAVEITGFAFENMAAVRTTFVHLRNTPEEYVALALKDLTFFTFGTRSVDNSF